MLTEPVKPVVEKIAHECEKAGATKWEAIKIIKELSMEEKASEQKLKEKALAALRSLNPEAAKVFESFARMHVHNSMQLIEQFDRGNIVKSLLLETHSNRAIAEKIGAEVEDRIKDLKISHLTTSLIREMVNAKLLEYGLEDLRNKYARLGMPVADIEKEIGKGLFENKEILMEYSLLVAIPKELSENHFKADLHICNAEDFCTKPFGTSIQLANHAVGEEAFITGLLEKTGKLGKFFSQPVNLGSLNFSLAAALAGVAEKKAIKKAVFAFDCLKSAFAFTEKKPSVTLSLFVPEAFEKNSSQKQEAMDIANAMIASCSGTGFQPIITVDSKYCLKALNPTAFENELVFLNCQKEEFSAANPETAFPSQKFSGILAKICLNAEKIAFENTGKESAFEEDLLQKIVSAKKIIELKNNELEKRHYLKEKGIMTTELAPVLGTYRFMESIAILLEKKEIDRETQSVSERMQKKMRETLGEGWILAKNIETPAKNRFAFFNEKEFRQQAESSREIMKAAETTGIARSRKELEQAIENNELVVNYCPERQAKEKDSKESQT